MRVDGMNWMQMEALPVGLHAQGLRCIVVVNGHGGSYARPDADGLAMWAIALE